MKRFISLLLSIILLFTITGCLKHEEKQIPEPDIEQIRSICNLATLECYYHNVAKMTKKAGKGFTHIGEKDRRYWIEYTGIVKFGIDMSEVQSSLDGTVVKIYIPDAKVLSVNIDKDNLSEENFIMDKNGFNENKITSEDQSKAIHDAQKNMEIAANENKSLLLSAQTRAKDIIKTYITNLGNLVGIEYEIRWVDSPEEVKPTTPATT